MRRKHLEFHIMNHMRLTFGFKLTLNKYKFDWETMNTRIIKVIFNSKSPFDTPGNFWNDYGTRIQIKCYQKIGRISQTFDGVKCVNWEFMDSFGIRSVGSSVVHKFYSSVNWRGIGQWLTITSKYFMIQNL